MSTITTTIPIQIRVDKGTRDRANELFKELGTDMSGAVNMFLRQCVMTDSIPLSLKKPRFNRGLQEAIDEAEQISTDPDAKTYETLDELWDSLDI